MRVHPKGNPLWRWWWPLGGVALVGLIAIGVIVGWSANLWAAAGVVAVVYVGAPVTAATLDDLAGRRKPPAGSGPSQSGPDAVQAPVDWRVRFTGTPVSELPHEMAAATDVPAAGEHPPWQHGTAGSTDVRQAAAVQRSPAAADPPPREMLQAQLAAKNRRPLPPTERSGDRPWRRVGSAQFADLVYALGAALPSVSLADDTAGLAGVTRHLIRKGRDNPVQRWQAVLEQAIDDEADDALCAAALKLTNSVQLRAAVADWIGASDDLPA